MNKKVNDELILMIREEIVNCSKEFDNEKINDRHFDEIIDERLDKVISIIKGCNNDKV